VADFMAEQAQGAIDARYLTPAQAAKYSGIPVSTLNAWRYEGRGPNFYKPAGRVLYDRQELDSFIRSGLRKSSSVRAKATERIA
jgi:predicted site-specific integrase-resolvase